VKSIKKPKGLGKEIHTSNQKKVSGDYYGTAIKNKVGRIIDNYDMPAMKPSKSKKKPISLA